LHPLSSLNGKILRRIDPKKPVRVRLTREPGGPKRTARIRSTAVHALSATNLVVEPQSELLLQAGRFFRQAPSSRFGQRNQRENLSGASHVILWNSANFCLAPEEQVQPEAEVPSGIVLTGQGSTNWYHWLINILPKAFIAEQILALPVDIPFLVPKSIQGTRLEEALLLVSSGLREVVHLEERPYLVREAIVIESPSRENYRPKNVVTPVNWSRLGDFSFDLMGQYSNHMISKAAEQAGHAKEGRPSRVFFVRENLTRPYNQNEVEALLQGFGFTGIDLASLPVSEQIMIMASCKQAVGPTGAQWAGWLFTTGATGLILIPKFLKSSSLFSKLGVPGQSELLEFRMDSEHLGWIDYWGTSHPTRVNVQDLANEISSLA
jgi:hypothetical protein